MKQINPSIIKPLKETLSTIYWTKSDLKSFLYSCFRPETISIIDTLILQNINIILSKNWLIEWLNEKIYTNWI